MNIMISIVIFLIVAVIAITIGIIKTKKADKEAEKAIAEEPEIVPVEDVFHNLGIQSEVPKVKVERKKPVLKKKSATIKKTPQTKKSKPKPKTKK